MSLTVYILPMIHVHSFNKDAFIKLVLLFYYKCPFEFYTLKSLGTLNRDLDLQSHNWLDPPCHLQLVFTSTLGTLNQIHVIGHHDLSVSMCRAYSDADKEEIDMEKQVHGFIS